MNWKVVYKQEDGENEVIAEVTTNLSISVWDALEIAGVDMDEYAEVNGWEGYDPEALELELQKMSMEQAFEIVLKETDGKINGEQGVMYYKNLKEFYEATGYETVKGLTNTIHCELTDQFEGDFIAYDYLNQQFTFLTNPELSYVESFIDDITSK